MSPSLSMTANRLFSALAVSLALAAPAAADHWHGPYGMGHGYCQNHPPGGHGGDHCPLMQERAGPGPMGGKTLGVLVSDLPSAMLDAASLGYGINVERVQPDSPAAAAGIRAGDLIVEFAGKPVFSGERLRWLVRQAEAGKGMEIKLMREGKPLTVNATLNAPEPPANCPPQDKPRSST